MPPLCLATGPSSAIPSAHRKIGCDLPPTHTTWCERRHAAPSTDAGPGDAAPVPGRLPAGAAQRDGQPGPDLCRGCPRRWGACRLHSLARVPQRGRSRCARLHSAWGQRLDLTSRPAWHRAATISSPACMHLPRRRPIHVHLRMHLAHSGTQAWLVPCSTGACAGLRLAPRGSHLTRAWIMHNRPATPNYQHGGLLMGLGLIGAPGPAH